PVRGRPRGLRTVALHQRPRRRRTCRPGGLPRPGMGLGTGQRVSHLRKRGQRIDDGRLFALLHVRQVLQGDRRLRGCRFLLTRNGQGLLPPPARLVLLLGRRTGKRRIPLGLAYRRILRPPGLPERDGGLCPERGRHGTGISHRGRGLGNQPRPPAGVPPVVAVLRRRYRRRRDQQLGGRLQRTAGGRRHVLRHVLRRKARLARPPVEPVVRLPGLGHRTRGRVLPAHR